MPITIGILANLAEPQACPNLVHVPQLPGHKKTLSMPWALAAARVLVLYSALEYLIALGNFLSNLIGTATNSPLTQGKAFIRGKKVSMLPPEDKLRV